MTDLGIDIPWQYNFPPFFTLQPHTETRTKQLAAWKTLILDYFKFHKICVLDVREVSDIPIFNNSTINRVIQPQALQAVLTELEKSGNASAIDKQENRWEIYWHTLDEFASIVYNYITANNMLDTVLTFYELLEGDDVKDEAFYKLNSDIFVKILRNLEAQEKCELIMFDDNQGVKFF